MAEVLVFHHAQGLTLGVRAFAERLEQGGHTVHTPDLYVGETFNSLEAGIAHAQEIGFDTVGERASVVAQSLPRDLVYVGFSLGVLPAQRLAQTRLGARGAVLVSGAVPASGFGAPWPAGARLQVHLMEDDPIAVTEGDLDAARGLVDLVDGAVLYLYPGQAHLFADSSLPAYDLEASDLLTERVLALLAEVG